MYWRAREMVFDTMAYTRRPFPCIRFACACGDKFTVFDGTDNIESFDTGAHR